MKKLILFAAAIAIATAAFAQGATSYCPGLKNPTSFTSGIQSGAVVGYYSGQTGDKPYTAPDALSGTTGVNMTSAIIPANQLASTSSSGSCSIPQPSNRFRICSANEGPGSGSQLGKDPNTGYGLPYVPSTLASDINKSIRLGNCGTGAEAEALYYTMSVRPENALLFIYYAIVVEAPGHGPTGDPSFVIRVSRNQGTNASPNWQQISDTLCYAVSSSGLTNNVNGWHQQGSGYNAIFWREWNKVAINLNNYLYENVRIEMYMGDCAAHGHYGYCYIAGECQPMEIKAGGCPAGATTTVTTLTAPSGLNNYVWYKSDMGSVNSIYTVPPTWPFSRLTTATSTNNVYNCQIEDFGITQGDQAGELTNIQSFRCDMTSAMDPAKPYLSKVYVTVTNTKPLMSIDTIKTCDSELHLTNKSYVPGSDSGVDTSLTEWWFHEGSTGETPVSGIRTGGQVDYTFPGTGTYAVHVRTHTPTDTACYSDAIYPIFVLGRPNTQMYVSDHELCDTMKVTLRDNTEGSVRRKWIFEDGTTNGLTPNDNIQVNRSFDNFSNPVELVSYNGLYTLNAVNTADTIWCTKSAFDTIYVFQHPELTVSGDRIVCNGDRTDAIVSTEAEGCHFQWYRYNNRPGDTPISNDEHLQVYPYADTCTYYVKVTSNKGCVAWDSAYVYVVKPKLARLPYTGRTCAGDTVTLLASAADHYSWYATPTDSTLIDLLDSNGHGNDTLYVNPTVSTTYTLIGHGSNDCNAAPLSIDVEVLPIPVATVNYDPLFIDSDDPVVTFKDVSPDHSFTTWLFHNGDAEDMATGSRYQYNFGEVEGDSVMCTLISANELGCADTLDFWVPTMLFTYYAPNIFSPGRGDNNKFRIFTINEYEHFHINIYDRRGALVFSSEDPLFEWDGTDLNGKPVPQGSYAYIIQYRRPFTDDVVTQKGAITVLR